MKDWQTRFEAELAAAEEARRRKNEGRARVCARRALGVLLDAWFEAQEIPYRNPSAYDKVRFFVTLEHLPEDVRATARHFLVRVTPEYTLPIEADLVEEARWLRERLLP